MRCKDCSRSGATPASAVGAVVKAAIAHGWITCIRPAVIYSSCKLGRTCRIVGAPKGTLGRALGGERVCDGNPSYHRSWSGGGCLDSDHFLMGHIERISLHLDDARVRSRSIC
jgi:hypothetical protein